MSGGAADDGVGPGRAPGGAGAATADEAALARCAEELADGVEAALPGWVERCVARRVEQWAGHLPVPVAGRARDMGQRARRELGPRVRALLALDVDEQPTTPLALLREGVRYPGAVLEDAGVPPVERDEFAERALPADRYDLAPANFADVDARLAEPALRWGAAKAYVVLSRRRAEGRR